MSFLGKLMIVLVLFMSILFMTLGLVVNRTHRDLKADAAALAQQVNLRRSEYDQLVQQHKKLDVQVRRETQAALAQLCKLESERVALVERNSLLRTGLQELKNRRSEKTGEVARAQDDNNKLARQVEDIRMDTAQTQAAGADVFVQALNATEELHQLQGQLENTLERNRELSRNR